MACSSKLLHEAPYRCSTFSPLKRPFVLKPTLICKLPTFTFIISMVQTKIVIADSLMLWIQERSSSNDSDRWSLALNVNSWFQQSFTPYLCIIYWSNYTVLVLQTKGQLTYSKWILNNRFFLFIKHVIIITLGHKHVCELYSMITLLSVSSVKETNFWSWSLQAEAESLSYYNDN